MVTVTIGALCGTGMVHNTLILKACYNAANG